jgi:fibronectin type 3 domain-containing protein
VVWTPDTDTDLAGYNLYRREEGGAEMKINQQLLSSSSYRDSSAVSGHTYFYSVSAVDARGNESAHSEEAHETLP